MIPFFMLQMLLYYDTSTTKWRTVMEEGVGLQNICILIGWIACQSNRHQWVNYNGRTKDFGILLELNYWRIIQNRSSGCWNTWQMIAILQSFVITSSAVFLFYVGWIDTHADFLCCDWFSCWFGWWRTDFQSTVISTCSHCCTDAIGWIHIWIYPVRSVQDECTVCMSTAWNSDTTCNGSDYTLQDSCIFLKHLCSCILSCRRTVSMEVGCQNIQLCTTILKVAFPAELIGQLYFFPVIYIVFQIVEALIFILLFRCHQKLRPSQKGL